MSRIRLAIHGASGRMGLRLIELIAEDPALELGAAIERPGHPLLGEKIAGVTLVDRLESRVDVALDFSMPSATLHLADSCARFGTAMVVGTTGFEPELKRVLEKHADRLALLVAPNMSRAVNLLMRLVGEAARALGREADIEIVERHHHFKQDAPSGTALRLAEIAAEAIGSKQFVHGRHGIVGERPRGEIGLHALRAGDSAGEHTVVYGLLGECLELTHRAANRDGFARGALDAAKFLAGKPPGIYTVDDWLNAPRTALHIS